MVKVISLRDLIDKEAVAVNKYRIWSEDVLELIEREDENPYISSLIERSKKKTEEAVFEIESARKELANAIRGLMSKY